ncbi:response regulator transcription factor [Aestuariibacter sp. AA17]|uniref:Response regulator transcription factor n=1 Tax=Fluctibacter corallii TaxID=2984329 RepID=A0ABT3A535_9ALTE|nr:response regulator transcription factor [Aestuariibacter sp. AA17]MCV2883486.1 response regulator transcription factor [Aestuariibacter sp. AA17]
MSIRVLLVDDQTLVRLGIRSLLALSDKLTIVGEAQNGIDALEKINELQPDVVLMDIQMPEMSGIEAVEKLQTLASAPPVIMLTTFDDHQLVMEAVSKGAKGYLLKDVSLETLVEGIEAVHSGKSLIQPAITERVVRGLKSHKVDFESASQPEPLSEKEKEILRLMAAGCSNKEISNIMFKSEGTVKNQVSNVLSKLGVRDRTRAVLKAIEQGMI